MDGYDGVIQSAIVQTNDGVYKRQVVKLTPVLPGKDVFAMENRAGDVIAELTNSMTKLISASRPFQALKLEEHEERHLMLHSTEDIRIWSVSFTFIFSNYCYCAIVIHEVKLKLEIPLPTAKQYYDLTVLHQILCNWIANQPDIDTENSTKLLRG